MKIYVLIPVFNRLAHTKEILGCLRRQTGVDLQVVIVDDGSTDGTAEFLAAQPDVLVLHGDGQLWWAGAIDLALRTVAPKFQAGDYFLFMNNDTRIDDGYVACLVRASLQNGRAVVGSIVRDAEPPHALLDIGPRANLWDMHIWDIARDIPESERQQPAELYPVDFLPGRGTLYPAEVVAKAGFMRPRLLPHYHADYEFADRARRAGFRLLVASSAVTYSTASFGNQRRFANARQRLFGKGSPENLPHKIAFFMLVGSPQQRLTAPLRMLAQAERRAVFRARERIRQLMRRVVRSRVVQRLYAVPVVRKVVDATLGRALLLVRLRRSTMARARVCSAIERRWRRRMEALHVYAAALLVGVGDGGVALLGSAGERHRSFFANLGVRPRSGPSAGPADIVFVALDAGQDALIPAELSALQPRPDGVVYAVCYGAQGPAGQQVQALASRLAADPTFQVLADMTLDEQSSAAGTHFLPPQAFAGARSVTGHALAARIVAARRLR